MSGAAATAATSRPAPAPAGCPACGATATLPRYRDCSDRRHWRPGRFAVERCAGCGLGWTVPQLGAAELAAFYPSSYVSHQPEAEASDSGRRRLAAALLRLPYTLRYGPESRTPPPPHPGACVLDLGCGLGGYLQRLARRGWEPWGLEPDAAAAAAAQRRLSLPPGRILAARAEQAEFEEGRFELVTMVHVLEHLHEPAAVLAKVRSWLRPSGVLRLWLPNAASLEARLFGRLWFGLDLPRHLYHFTPASLRALLARAGFHVERLVPEFEASSLAGSLSQLADRLRGRRLDYRPSRAFYLAALPPAALLRALGAAACLDCTARRAA